MAADTTVERIAGWAAGLDPSTIPDDVLRLARAQRRSVLGAVAASGADEASRRVLGAVSAWATPGPAPVPATDVRGRVEDALYAAAALSVALDFDDYLCFAHTGHSGVLVPLLLAAEHPASGREQLAAQVIANEVGGRLGGACLVGPLNGQLWSFVHAAGAALAAGRVLGLDAVRLAHGLALALTAAPRPTVPGFMAPDSKLLTAAEPAVAGLRAARLAAAGVTGPLDVLDHPQGFFSAFAYAPLPALLDALGAGWATRTLCVKPYPGCAYLDTTLDALGEIGPVPAAEVAGVDVDAGILTVGMDAMSAGYARADPTPVTVTFSVPWNVAVHVVAGRVTADEVAGPWLRAHAGDLARLAGGVRLRHSWPLTRRTLAAMRTLLPPAALTRGVDPRRLLAGIRATRASHTGVRVGPGDALELLRLLRPLGHGSPGGAQRSGRVWDPRALETFAMAFPAQVGVRLRDGTMREASVDVPRGAAGHPTEGPEAVAAAKLALWGPRLWGERTAADIERAVAVDAPDIAGLLHGPAP